ncbi:J domain-containing protein [Curvibacter sp. HBC28]|uniref:J domain-containing protein n=1 Tax=Curvibacter microcysteis TaxID=3026419 RepID=A0ABT5M9H6_9BURK|nr:J domain-containing protein [Curvibacter sp. HBC28]MDD0813245.1 J domain-containing protein [Curvibacter sp. HBC28]
MSADAQTAHADLNSMQLVSRFQQGAGRTANLKGPMNSLYETLQVSPKASSQVIRAAYRCLAQHIHPDKHPDIKDGGDRLAIINQAYAILSDPEKRQSYDLKQSSPPVFVERRGRGAAAQSPTSGKRPPSSRLFSFRPLV